MSFRQVGHGKHSYVFNDDTGRWDRTLFADKDSTEPGRQSRRGRGAVTFFSCDGIFMVRKQYRRGGLFGRLVQQRYFFTGLNNTRMWQEFHLLRRMHSLGLPVPRVIAAECERQFFIFCKGWLITEEIPQSLTLAQHLEASPLTSTQWYEVGKVVRSFHDHSIFHADLNANNILLDAVGRIWLIDFDKSRVRAQQSEKWKQENTQRFLRSLKKIGANSTVFHFRETDWENFQRGYDAG